MTSAPVNSAMEALFVPRTDHMKTPEGNADFAGSLQKAVDKKTGSNPEAKEQDIASKEQSTKPDETTKTSKPKEVDQTTAADKTKDSKVQEPSTQEVGKMEEDEEITTASETVMTMYAPLETQVVMNPELTEEQVEALDGSLEQMMNNLTEQLDVSENDVREAMNTLSLKPSDLLQPENVTKLFMEITGVEDSISLVMDEPLYQAWQETNELQGEILDNLQEELQLPTEQILPMLDAEDAKLQLGEQAQELQEGSELAAVVTTKEQVGVVENLVDNTKGAMEQETTEIPAEATTQGEIAKAVDALAPADKEQDGQGKQGFGETKKQETVGEKPWKMTTETATNEQALSFNEQVAQNAKMNGDLELVEAQSTESASTTSLTPSSEEIAEQILEYMKVQIKEDVTELEMQLHPASLGNVHVSLVSREGNITAQFTAQNEAVKQAMETQIVQLKEQFEEQGIKIEAVEVTVASHQFEKQYSGEEQRDAQNGQSKAGKVHTRRINLEELDEEEIEQLLTDEEKLHADMMRKNGNTVDFTA